MEQDGATPVYIAAQRDAKVNLMELLLEKGGDPNTPNKVSLSTPVKGMETARKYPNEN